MQHTVDSKRQFLSNKIKLETQKTSLFQQKLRKSQNLSLNFGKVEKIEAQEKRVFLL